MTWLEQLAILAAGVAAGGINTIVGSGTLITFPALLAFGLPPVTANVSNTVGLVPGSISGVIGYRRELAGQRGRLLRLGSASLLGGITGALLLLWLPSDAFDAIVPVLIIAALILVVVQPRLAAWVKRRREENTDAGVEAPKHGGPVLLGAVYLTGIYGGYFGAAQGVLLLGLLGVLVHEDIQRLNAVKNVLALLVNAVAAAIFIMVAEVNWVVVALIAAGSIVGGQLGARVGRKLPPNVLRAVIVVVGTIAVVRLLIT
ncbi:MAG TPA: sulfite exporter TauE/SafE family protein [Nocardia sp.]|uniref:sulfite exporter TauE/SafE family protein n=1 Tax=Nocardia TaxID=1817 RepID=UPI002454E9CE|nr:MULTISPECIES: sulfite exporter TauE/SafE family protein [Nocardia]HLS78056.1 sulfite exporter TauE/SafE family protein [Nocardia sp.]